MNLVEWLTIAAIAAAGFYYLFCLFSEANDMREEDYNKVVDEADERFYRMAVAVAKNHPGYQRKIDQLKEEIRILVEKQEKLDEWKRYAKDMERKGRRLDYIYDLDEVCRKGEPYGELG